MSRLSFARWFGILTDGCLGFIIVALPGLMGSTFALAELYKQATLVILICLAWTAWMLQVLLERKAEVRVGFAHLPLFGYGVAVFVAGFLSLDRYGSFVGDFDQRASTVVTVLALISFAWLLGQRVRSIAHLYNTLFLFFVGSFALGLASIFTLSQQERWNPAGSVYALSLIMAMVLVMILALLLHRHRREQGIFGSDHFAGTLARGSVWFVLVLALGLLLIVNFWVGWMGVLIGVALLFLMNVKMFGLHRLFFGRRWFLLPLFIISLICLFAPVFWKVSLPGEVALSTRASWHVVERVLTSSPWFGTGPSTWIYNHALYRPSIINLSPFWATRFDQGSSWVLTSLATIGMVGTIAFFLFVGSLIVIVVRHLWKLREEAVLQAWILPFIGWLVSIVFLFFFSLGFSHQIFFWTCTGCLLGLSASRTWTFYGTRGWVAFALPIKTAVVAIASGVIIFFVGRLTLADVRFSHAVSAYQAHTIFVHQIIPVFESLYVLDPWRDVFSRALSQAYLARLLQIDKNMSAEERARSVAQDAAKAVEYALLTTRLNPAHSDHWAQAGLVYARIAPFTKGADVFALSHYQEALRRDPQNPVYFTETGYVYLFQAEQASSLLEAKEALMRLSARETVRQTLLHAQEAFINALARKADYVPAHYALGLTFERQEKAAEALRAFETVVQLDGQHTQARFHLGVLYEEAGRDKEALQQWREVALRMPENVAVQQRLKALERKMK